MAELRLEEFKYGMKGKGDKPLYVKVTAFYPERERLILKLTRTSRNILSYWRPFVFFLASALRSREPVTAADCERSAEAAEGGLLYQQKGPSGAMAAAAPTPSLPLYRLHDQRGNREYTVTFGKQALMLEPLLLQLRDRDEDEKPIIM